MMTWLLAFTFFAHGARATAPIDDLVKVTAIAQFVEGAIQKTEASGQKSDLVFQTPLYEGDRIDTGAANALKVATRNGCVFVLRGDGTLAAPVGAKPWRLRAASLRIVCRGRAVNETFGVANLPLVMRDGEVLFANKQVMLVNGAASYMGIALVAHKLYFIDGSSLKEVSPQQNESDLRAFNLAEKPPSEGFAWPYSEPVKPEKIYTTRLMIGPVGGGDGVRYDNPDFSEGGLRGGGGRLQMHFKRGNDTSFIVALTARDSQKNSDETFNQPPEGVQNSLEFQTLEFGVRQKHDRWWSPFVRAGVGAAKAKISYNTLQSFGGCNCSTYSYEFYVVTATAGLDAHLTPHFLRPFGVFVGAEATVYQSVHRGARRNDQSNTFYQQTVPNEAWRLTGFDALVSGGVEFDF